MLSLTTSDQKYVVPPHFQILKLIWLLHYQPNKNNHDTLLVSENNSFSRFASGFSRLPYLFLLALNHDITKTFRILKQHIAIL